jgi:hypothetical protein
MNSKAMGSESERFAPGRAPNSAILLALTRWKEGRRLRTPAILANGPRRLTDQPCPIASMTTRNSTSATATTR